MTPTAIEGVIRLAERDDISERRDRLMKESQDIEKRIGRLVSAIETGGNVPSLLTKLQEYEARQQVIRTELADLRPVPRLAPSVESRLAEWRQLLRASIRPEDTFDADYEQVLGRAYQQIERQASQNGNRTANGKKRVKVGTSPTGFAKMVAGIRVTVRMPRVA